jgi:hypothetical protein
VKEHLVNDHISNAMSSLGPYRRSIWLRRAAYSLAGLTEHQLEIVARVHGVMAAKLRVLFPTPAACLALVEAIADVPNNPGMFSDETLEKAITAYLEKARALPGFNIKTAMCMLAVETEGAYAPADRRISTGLLNRRVVSEDDRDALESSSTSKFVRAYVGKIMPEWKRARQTRSARDVDDDWGSDK